MAFGDSSLYAAPDPATVATAPIVKLVGKKTFTTQLSIAPGRTARVSSTEVCSNRHLLRKRRFRAYAGSLDVTVEGWKTSSIASFRDARPCSCEY